MTTRSQTFVRLCDESDLEALRLREPHSSARFADKHFQLQQEGSYLYAVAFISDELAGTGVLDLRPGPLVPELKNLWVYPEHRRLGAGRALTEFLEEHAGQRGYEEVFLGVDPDNYSAIPLYLDLGYSPTGHHREAVYVWVDGAGESHNRKQMDAIYRKSLLMQR
ncbi:GNAT family N-acetyltransferase [Propionicicella superfundia]|uniref:GNAT family N-acetyltransferase n=1 Tax=Propionicicella superfundia TaxID=348582 RepID=UPI0003FCED7B|nr:GNAT family N-acetyltransferase [Propionicicella superfundia]